jgi:hypothetical protein
VHFNKLLGHKNAFWAGLKEKVLQPTDFTNEPFFRIEN